MKTVFAGTFYWLIIPQSHESFLSMFDPDAARPDKGYSLNNYISMQTIRR